MFTRYLCWALASCLLFSCEIEAKKKNVAKTQATNKDTTHLINLLKSYEPEIYKGKVPDQFYKNRGAFDFWRFPLVYPYSIGCIDVKDYGNIYSDKDKSNYEEGGSIQPLTEYFDIFTLDKSFFVARKVKSPFTTDTIKIADQYFIFSFSNGISTRVNGIDNLRRKLNEIGFTGDTTFMTIREYGNRL